MKAVLVDVLLAVAVASSWLGCLGFARLRAPFDKIHCVTFVNVACGLPVLLAALLQEGPTNRVFKITLILALSLLNGAAISHATARALKWREKAS